MPDPVATPPALTKKKFLAPFVLIIALAGILVGWHFWHRPPNLAGTSGNHDPVSLQVNSFDDFQNALARRVMEQLQQGSRINDMSAIVATAAYPIGTLLRPQGAIPAAWDSCKPANLPPPFSAARLFPSYRLSSQVAVDANIGARAIQGLNNAGVNLAQTSEIQYTVNDVFIQMLDDVSLDSLISTGACRNYLSQHPGSRLIRGAVTGKVTFTVKADSPATVKANLLHGGFQASDDPDSHTVSVTDFESEPIVELLSEFNPTSQNPAATPKPQAVATGSAAAPPGGPARTHIYIEQDTADTKANATGIVKYLSDNWPSANVEHGVEKIPSAKMPAGGQVRYFNDADLPLARKCVDILKNKYPSIRAVRIGLSSPRGQLEVWMPKVSPS
jgi:hypothetical protein